ncbi:Orotidine 5'-phosphate decarboxylase [Conexivisphaera calida]|uniref:Orotidine 5'-phosphate decarboxylase n=1 Tax=Conexivisphaera calida TaxID=1874277 RepID=A0A4P2VF04_9ARCH|nr:Orotidine 5'-phosphate decarboxylase [Conexivisphaera calida]
MPGAFAARIIELSRKDPIVIALDDPLDDVLATLRELSLGVPLNLKVGWMPVLHGGLSAITRAKELAQGGLVIADLKIADVPHVSGGIARALFNAGADGVIIHGFLGPDVISEVVHSAQGSGVLVVAETTNPGASLCYPRCSDSIAAAARDAGADGIIAPATRPERITALRRIIGRDLVIVSPGVGAQGGDAAATIAAGADMIVVGRSIMRSKDPALELARLRSEALRSLPGHSVYR